MTAAVVGDSKADPQARPRILMSARDVGAGLSIAEVAVLAARTGALDVVLVAQEPALSRLREAGLDVVACEAPAVDSAVDPALSRLTSAARDLLSTYRPQALLVGLSGPGAGLDEALLAAARVPHSYAFQDYWGDVNETLGKPAETFFVLDDQAARLTRERTSARVVTVGSPKHARYASLDAMELRDKGRAAWRLGAQDAAILFLGQPLWDTDGYGATLDALAVELKPAVPDATVIYRQHPKETGDQSAEARHRLRGHGLKCHLDGSPIVEESLAAADLAVSCFSTAGYDLLMLSRQSSQPLASVAFLLCDQRLQAWYEEKSRLSGHPLADQGLALLCRDRSDLAGTLQQAMSESCRVRLWQAARQALPDPADAGPKIIETILDNLGLSPGSRRGLAKSRAG